jgi:hypothetical protein
VTRRETATAYLLIDVVVLRLHLASCWAFLVEGDSNVEVGNVRNEHSRVHKLGNIVIRGTS